MRIDDNGVGLDPALIAHDPPGHFGLRGMHERAAHLNARLTFVSAPGAGTHITLVVPGQIAFHTASDSQFNQDKTCSK
jgi:signal transduction histidine kinase